MWKFSILKPDTRMTGMFPCLVFAATIIAISGKTNDWKSCCNVCWYSQGITCPLSSVPVQGLWNGRIFSCWLASQVLHEGHSCLTTFSTVVLSTTRFGLTVMFGDCETLLYFAFQEAFLFVLSIRRWEEETFGTFMRDFKLRGGENRAGQHK